MTTVNRDGPLFDVDVMPWGKHKGKKLVSVPLWYWKWFLGLPMREYWPGLRDYAKLRLGLDELPPVEKKHDKRPHGPAMPTTAWIGAEVSGTSEEAPF